MAERKSFLLRVDRDTLDAVQRWANDDLRSLNGQIEFLLRRALQQARRVPVRADTGGEAVPGGGPVAGREAVAGGEAGARREAVAGDEAGAGREAVAGGGTVPGVKPVADTGSNTEKD